MKIEIEVKDIETLAKALNNALSAYGDICSSVAFGIDPQINKNKFSELKTLPEEELKNRFYELKDIYLQIEVLERQMKEEEK